MARELFVKKEPRRTVTFRVSQKTASALSELRARAKAEGGSEMELNINGVMVEMLERLIRQANAHLDEHGTKRFDPADTSADASRDGRFDPSDEKNEKPSDAKNEQAQKRPAPVTTKAPARAEASTRSDDAAA